MEGATGESPGASPESPNNNPGRKHESRNADVPVKKKKLFQPLKSLKKLFTGRKRTKSKEEHAAPRARSAESVLQPDEDERSNLSKKQSMSEDSVFNSGKPRESPGDALTISMEALPRNNDFKNELVKKLKNRRQADDDDDEDADAGLPHSPPGHTTTADALIENGLKGDVSMHSDHSLGSMDSDNEGQDVDFFSPMASGSSLKDSGSNVDLDAIPQGSTTNLANPSAYHKMAVKPKKPGRPGGRTTNAARKTAISPVPGAVKVLPQLEEEKPATDGDITPDEDYDVDSSNDEIEERPEKKAKEESTPHRPKETQCNYSESTVAIEIQKNVDVNDEASKKSATEPVNSVIVIRNDSQKKAKETDRPVDSQPVVMRAKHGVNTDVSKRQTIATETEVTPFGARKKRASVVLDTKNWDDLEKQKENSGESTQQGSEFAKMFNKFQRKSIKKDSPVKESKTIEVRPASKIYSSPTVSPDTGAQNKKIQGSGDAAKIQKKKENNSTPEVTRKVNSGTPKQALIIEKSSTNNEKTADKIDSVKPASIVKNRPVHAEQTTPGSLKNRPVHAEETTPGSLKNRPVHSEETTPGSLKNVEIKDSSKTEKPKSKKKVVIKSAPSPIDDRKNSNTTKSETDKADSGMDSAFKRDSPLIKNRARSQTLPEQPDIKNILKDESKSQSVKRTASSVSPTKAASQGSPSSPSKKPEPKKLGGGGGGDGPSWIAMARKKTTGWNEDKDKELETKKEEDTPSAPESWLVGRSILKNKVG